MKPGSMSAEFLVHFHEFTLYTSYVSLKEVIINDELSDDK
jgi:hypothetical protein